jgi:uncharacterized membrane protein
MNVSDKVVSLLRTAVPVVWGYVVAWALAQIPAAQDFLASFGVDLNSVAVVNFVTGLATIAWYAVWRWAEPRIPAWLTRLVLGSNKAPTYAPVGGDGVPDITSEG